MLTIFIASLVSAVVTLYTVLFLIGCLVGALLIKDDEPLRMKTFTDNDDGPNFPLIVMAIFFTFPAGVFLVYWALDGFKDNKEEIDRLNNIDIANKRIRELEEELADIHVDNILLGDNDGR